MEDKLQVNLGGLDRDDEDHSKLKAWEDLCEGTYPGYGDTELEARAYASLAEVLDEAKSREVVSLMGDRITWSSDILLFHKAYEEDERIADLVNLLLHHGWEPPVHLAHTNMSSAHAVYPHDLEHIDYGEMMQELEEGRDSDYGHSHSSTS